MAGKSNQKIFTIPVRAEVVDAAVDTDDIRTAINAAIAAAAVAGKQAEAAVSPIGENQKPRMLKITAWICHAGAPNRNAMAFVDEDLRDAVEAGLFQAPYFGMIDYNHDFQAYGAWYKAEYKYNPVAKQHGILAEGAIFAWRYEDLSDKLLAMQSRQGYIDVSMACIPERYEYVEPEGEAPYYILRNPVFFTTSVLTVDPADPNARGIGSEDIEQDSKERERELNKAEVALGQIDVGAEDNMEELIARVEKLLGEHKADLSPLVEAAQRVPVLEQEVASAIEAKDALDAALAEERTAKETVEVALEAMKSEVETANKTIETLTAELEELRAFKAEVEAEAAEAEAAAKLEARLTELGDSFKASLAAKAEDVRNGITTRIKTMDDAAWQDFKAALSLASAKTFADRSADEGTMVMASEHEGDYAISKWINR